MLGTIFQGGGGNCHKGKVRNYTGIIQVRNHLNSNFFSGDDCPWGNYHRGNFPGQLSERGVIFFEDNYPWWQLSEGNRPGGNFFGDNYLREKLSVDQFSLVAIAYTIRVLSNFLYSLNKNLWSLKGIFLFQKSIVEGRHN